MSIRTDYVLVAQLLKNQGQPLDKAFLEAAQQKRNSQSSSLPLFALKKVGEWENLVNERIGGGYTVAREYSMEEDAVFAPTFVGNMLVGDSVKKGFGPANAVASKYFPHAAERKIGVTINRVYVPDTFFGDKAVVVDYYFIVDGEKVPAFGVFVINSEGKIILHHSQSKISVEESAGFNIADLERESNMLKRMAQYPSVAFGMVGGYRVSTVAGNPPVILFGANPKGKLDLAVY